MSSVVIDYLFPEENMLLVSFIDSFFQSFWEKKKKEKGDSAWILTDFRESSQVKCVGCWHILDKLSTILQRDFWVKVVCFSPNWLFNQRVDYPH